MDQSSVNSNHNSRLLRLPPEIRNRIWEYTLGGMEFRQIHFTSRKRVFQAKPSERPNIFALLRVCRQIYAETALLPLAVNVLPVRPWWSLTPAVRPFRTYQIKQIEELRVEIGLFELCGPSEHWLDYFIVGGKFALLPNLRRVRVSLFSHLEPKRESKPLAEYESQLHTALDSRLLSAGYELVVEGMETSWKGLALK